MAQGDDATELAALRARLQRLEDLEEIRQLYNDYGRHLDECDFTSYAQLFARDAKLRLGPTMRADGRDEIQRVMTEQLGANPPRSFIHLLGTPHIVLDGDAATGECLWAAIAKEGEDGRGRMTSIGRHVDDLVREDGRWRIARRRGFLDMVL